MSLFEQQWQTYRTVLDHDSMEPEPLPMPPLQRFGAGLINVETSCHRLRWSIWAAVIWPISRRCSDRCL